MNLAPIPVEPLTCFGASPAPLDSSRSGAPTRRSTLAGLLAATLFPDAGRADDLAIPLGAAPPTLRVRIGEPMRLSLANPLDVPATFALLGLRSDPAPGFAGLSASPLAPGERRSLAFTPREAGFGLYGDYRKAGAFGAIVVEEAAPPQVDLDAVVVLSGDAASLRVNGAASLTLDARPGARIRLRLANASPDDFVSLSTTRTVQIVAIDGQPCEMFAPQTGALPLCPSARIELMFDLGDRPAEFALGDRALLRIVPSGERAAARPAIAALPANPRLPAKIALERALRVSVAMTGAGPYALNGIGGPDWPAKPLFKVKRGMPVVLALTNATPTPQTLRLEGHVARQLHGLDDGWDPYWRDALLVTPGQTLHIAFVADNPGKWPLASASPQRRAQGLAAWFLVN